MLADVEWPVFEEVARELTAQMTDAVIDEAMRQMPPPWYAIDGAQMTKDLRQRRDGIVEYARKFYLHLADRVDVRATDRADLASVKHEADGSLRLTLAPLAADGAAGAPYYERRFSPKDTKEIRLYLLGGNDRVVASGPRKGGIHVRVLGDAGNDTVDDSQSGGLDVEDGRGRQRGEARPGDEGEREGVDEPGPREGPPVARAPQLRPLDGADDRDVVAAQPGVHAGRRLHAHRLGVPQVPLGQHPGLHASCTRPATRASGRATRGQWRLTDVKLLGTVNARFSGIENRNFYGFGNETPNIEDKALHMTETNEYMVFPALSYRPSISFELHVGAEAKVIADEGGRQPGRAGSRSTGAGSSARRACAPGSSTTRAAAASA